MTSITLFARWKYQNLIFQLYICLHFSRIGYDHGSVVRWSLLCRHWHRSGTEISQRRWQSCFFESTKLHCSYQCKICSASTWRDWQKGMYIWMTAGFWSILNLFGPFFIYYMPIIFILQVEVKPYVLDDQLCDECQGARCGGKFAPFFCANVTCLQVCSIHTVRLSKIEYIEFPRTKKWWCLLKILKRNTNIWIFESIQNFDICDCQ